ncbi:MAG: methyltransferase [Flavobacteriales bacterium]
MSKTRNIVKRILNPIIKYGAKIYYRKPRKYKYQDIEVLVHPEVFPPHVTLSTKILLDFIAELDLQNKTFLELGCGSGIISLFASKKGAKVTATDINKTALDYLKTASEKNHLPLEILYSDLFKNLKNKSFNYIIINPPYYPKTPKNIKELAWFCGEDFQYFKNLFQQLPNFLTKKNKTYLILSEDCEISKIKELAQMQHISLEKILQVKKMKELNFVFKLQFI